MPIGNPRIEILVGLDPKTGDIQTRVVSSLCSSMVGSELWGKPDGSDYFLYHQDEFYDKRLRERRNSGNMLSPDGKSRLILWGAVWSVGTFESRFTLIGRTTLAR
jgi:hypothetical protein